jgi:hypothetical protein
MPGSYPASDHPEGRARTTIVALVSRAQNGTSRRAPPAGLPVTSTVTFGHRQQNAGTVVPRYSPKYAPGW